MISDAGVLGYGNWKLVQRIMPDNTAASYMFDDLKGNIDREYFLRMRVKASCPYIYFRINSDTANNYFGVEHYATSNDGTTPTHGVSLHNTINHGWLTGSVGTAVTTEWNINAILPAVTDGGQWRQMRSTAWAQKQTGTPGRLMSEIMTYWSSGNEITALNIASSDGGKFQLGIIELYKLAQG